MRTTVLRLDNNRSPAGRIIGAILICAFLSLVWWYIEAEDFAASKVAGRYVIVHDGITQSLTLKSDNTFEQEDTVGVSVKRAKGTWRVFSSTGHMAFSSSFIDARETWKGQENHEVYGIVKNYLGLISITFDGDASPPIKAYKRLFS